MRLRGLGGVGRWVGGWRERREGAGGDEDGGKIMDPRSRTGEAPNSLVSSRLESQRPFSPTSEAHDDEKAAARATSVLRGDNFSPVGEEESLNRRHDIDRRNSRRPRLLSTVIYFFSHAGVRVRVGASHLFAPDLDGGTHALTRLATKELNGNQRGFEFDKNSIWEKRDELELGLDWSACGPRLEGARLGLWDV